MEEKRKHSYGHTQYLRLANRLKEELLSPDNVCWFTIRGRLEAERIVKSRMPPELVKCDAWRKANDIMQKLNEQIEKLPEWAQEKAVKQLTQKAYLKHNIATGVWAGLMGIALLVGIVLVIREYKTRKIKAL